MVMDFAAVPVVRRFVRKPKLELWTLFHTNYISYDFVFRSSSLASFPNFDFYLDRNDAHLFLLYALTDATDSYGQIPQYLFLRDAAHVRENRELVRPYLQSYREYFERLGLTLDLIDGPSFYRLTPTTKPRGVSVIVPFRDKPELTCRAIVSVLGQKMEASLEIILVNNQSRPESIQYVQRFVMEQCAKEAIVRFLNYDLPFNHSAECNLGAREAGSECLIFLNNDVELISTDALMQMASWSLFSGVGTVGIRMMSTKDGVRASAGIALRLASGADYNSITEERNDEEFGHYNRETWGNSFACAAISRRTFNSIGALDEVNFPNGYNDVDYSMRCRKAGLRNIYLGTSCAVHAPGTSRGRCDELYKKILIRQKYPELFRDSLFQLAVENRNSVNTTVSQNEEKKGRFYSTLRKFGFTT
jgi:GT2 family glycosyltransferase